MIRVVFCILSVFALAAVCMGQAPGIEPTPTPVKVVVTNNLPAAVSRPVKPTPTPIIVGSSANRERVVVTTQSPASTVPAMSATPVPVPVDRPGIPATATVPASTPLEGLSYRSLSFRQLKNAIADARRQMQTRPLTTASTDGTIMTDFVRIAYQDWTTNKIDFVVITKDSFLAKNDEKLATSQDGKPLRIRTIRGNGVNTPVVIINDKGETQLPLLVQYPVVRNGKFIETAYYMSTHPGLVTPEVVNAGRLYVRNVVEIAREKLEDKGISVDPKIADIAERLATVEHVDHSRFRNEPNQNVFNDIFTLYALNEGQTYRYSVSSAGAGGMVQMIPSTYRMVRSWHPVVPLKPDFVEGMQDHVNATQAMLLYMRRTWADLIANPTIADAFSSGIATQEQLMAAGYNSNPARLAGYIKRGGANWTSLIPKETQIYLQIFDSLERNVPMTPRIR